MQTKILRAVLGIALTLGTACSVFAQPKSSTAEQAPHQRIWEIRGAGVQGDRSKMPLLLNTIALDPNKLDAFNYEAPYAEWALRSLAQLEAVEALPEIEKLSSGKSSLSRYARVIRARLLAQSETKTIADPKTRAEATLTRFLDELKLDVGQLNKARASLEEIKRSHVHAVWPLELRALRELADMVYHKRDAALARAARSSGINFEQDPYAELRVRLASLSDDKRLTILVSELSQKKAIMEGEEEAIRLAIDHGVVASRAAGTKLKQMQAQRKQYLPAGFSALLDVINSVGDKDQVPVVESLVNDSDLYVAGDAQRSVARLRSIEQPRRN